jgi:hypothetical protein
MNAEKLDTIRDERDGARHRRDRIGTPDGSDFGGAWHRHAH